MLKRVEIGGVAKEGAFALHSDEIFGFQFIEMMGERGIGDVKLFLDFSYHEALGMGGEQQLHDAQARLGAHGGKHVGKFDDLFERRLGA